MVNGTALITGASGGIGKEIARHLAGKGFDLILLSRNEAELRRLSDDLADAHGVEVRYLPLDLGDFEAAGKEIGSVLQGIDNLDVLVNAAGVIGRGTSSLTPVEFERLLLTNVLAVHNVCASCRDALGRTRPSHVFNMSSISAIDGSAPFGGYAASKSAVLGYSRSLAKELLSGNVKVTAICPDLVDTDMGSAVGGDAERMLSPRDVCSAIDFVMTLSPSAFVEKIVIRRAGAVGMQGAMEMASVRI